MTTSHSVQTKLNGNAISIETGKVAKQADGSVVVRCGGTMVLSTVVASRTAMEAWYPSGRDENSVAVAFAGAALPLRRRR